MLVTQFTECGNSNRMEKYGFQKILHGMEARDVNIKQITTDRHVQIKKFMREERPNICHQFDIWHVYKNIRKKWSKAAKKKSTSSFKKLIKSICNYFWWPCATCLGCEHTLGEKWTSILFHTQNKHNWLGYRFFHNCAHMDLSKKNQRDKEWLDPNSDSFKALQTVVLDKTLINDLKHSTRFSHIGNLEVYHSLLSKWVPKSTRFSYEGMIVWSQLAAVDFNLGSDLEQKTTKMEKECFDTAFSKIKNYWSAKPIKVVKNREKFHDMVTRSIEVVKMGLHLERAILPVLPQNIASRPKTRKRKNNFKTENTI